MRALSAPFGLEATRTYDGVAGRQADWKRTATARLLVWEPPRGLKECLLPLPVGDARARRLRRRSRFRGSILELSKVCHTAALATFRHSQGE
jgi:hypothetical protein